MRSRYSRRDQWEGREGWGERERRSRDLGPYRADENYFGRGEMYGRGYGPNKPEYRATGWHTGRHYGPEDWESDRYGRNYGPNYGRENKPDSWVGRSNFETG